MGMGNEQQPGSLGYIGDYTNQLCEDFSQTIARIPIKQAGLHGK